ncbi:MAG: RluA family pseudouridine synthase [Alphaproteobacteria bacterium]|nr:RluA family pseudouridine synthase [Alphaproteobacteria bacterium]MBU0797684.1 RluA family pseudouridine synthase [Alphaproteobacteria bacterium]MBU0887983.1 RluA family pseudouridine synthase [Alphaproteobacteria bacterium]MBU1811660.1 RluA family pseudouridine synthase [Alphaproteobacteria bacterium]MBU2092233.1 RluA family pseudouridine synthase [Alphaproteobacteria bacterium]
MTQSKSHDETIEVAVETGSEAGDRLDRFLAARLPEMSRSRLKALIEQGMVRDADRILDDPSMKVRDGQLFTLTLPPPEQAEPVSQDIPLTVVYEDADLIVLDKPAGMVVHPAPGNPDSTLVNALLAHCGDSLSGIGGVRRPGIVHRIDKDTSGLLVVAKNDRAHAGLSAQFADHSIDRAYVAIIWGVPMPPSGEITGNIGRSHRDRKKMAVVGRGESDAGKTALTRYRTLARHGDSASVVECRLETGRTHQIRVHLTAQGHPLVGDAVYGRNRGSSRDSNDIVKRTLGAFPRQALHARELGFSHPITGKRLIFQSDIPPDMRELLTLMGVTLAYGN